jgi:hypothetical protein
MCDLGVPCGKTGCPFEPKGGWPIPTTATSGGLPPPVSDSSPGEETPHEHDIEEVDWHDGYTLRRCTAPTCSWHEYVKAGEETP